MNDDERIEQIRELVTNAKLSSDDHGHSVSKLGYYCEGLAYDLCDNHVPFLISKIHSLESKLQKARDALDWLCCEGIAMLKVHEDAIRSDHGNSNFECVKARWERARQALAEMDKDE